MRLVLDTEEAIRLTRTGDLWLFRGRTAADRAIRTVTNAPVNHVGMAVVIDDLPPLLWHAELSKQQVDVWSGANHRGVQLHDLAEALRRWRDNYAQQAWLRQLTPEVGKPEEDAALRSIARLDGVPFPSMAKAATRWLVGRDAFVPRNKRGEWIQPEAAFCAETVALTLQEMGVLQDDRKAHWYDPGTFWSGGYLPVSKGWDYGAEVAVGPPPDPDAPVPSSRTRWRS